MHILIGLVLAAALLLAWLSGTWAGRVLMFVALVFTSVFVGFLFSYEAPMRLLTISALGGVASWFVAGMPSWYWRQRMAQLQAAQWRAPQQFRRLP